MKTTSPSHRDDSVHHGHHHSDCIDDDVIAFGRTSLGSTNSDRSGGSTSYHHPEEVATKEQEHLKDEESAGGWDWTSCLTEPIYEDEGGCNDGENIVDCAAATTGNLYLIIYKFAIIFIYYQFAILCI